MTRQPLLVGTTLPDVDLYELTPDQTVNLSKYAPGKKIIVFGVPGAFSPKCNDIHLPSFLRKSNEFKNQGIQDIFCVSVNDPFVMKAWADASKSEGKVRMLADPTAAFAKALGLTFEIPVLGLRSKRYVMVVEDGEIIRLNVEPDSVGLTCTLATNVEP